MNIKYRNILKTLLCALLIISFLIYRKISTFEYPPVVMSLGVSSNGKSVISIDQNKQLVLWNIKSRTSKLISTNANIYSAYFIPNSDKFMWQEASTNIVHIENSKGHIIKKFTPGFVSYGHSISKDLKNYIASDKNWNLFNIIGKKKNQFKEGFKDFYHGKNINITRYKNKILTSGVCGHKDDRQPISAGLTARDINPKIRKHVNYSLMNCIVLWNYKLGKALLKFHAHGVKTHATLSPDGKYVVSGDENSGAFVWETKHGEKIAELFDLELGEYIRVLKGRNYFARKNVIPKPKDYCWKYSSAYNDCISQYQIVAMKFINNEQFLRFTLHIPYAILYDVLNPNHKKYLKLEGYPSIHGFGVPASISTAPKKNILVMASKRSEGIRVYQFDRNKETLTLVWAPDEIQRTFKQKVQKLWRKLIA